MSLVSLPLRSLVPVLQGAIGPVILISGVGLLLLTLSNRFGRAVDRLRLLAPKLKGASDAEVARLRQQVDILYRRAGLIRGAITCVVTSVLLSAVLIISLFVSTLISVEAGVLIACLFILAFISLILGLLFFLLEIHLSLKALKIELFDA